MRPEVPAVVVTRTSTRPAGCAGRVTVSMPHDSTCTCVEDAPPKLTPRTLMKPDPLTVIVERTPTLPLETSKWLLNTMETAGFAPLSSAAG